MTDASVPLVLGTAGILAGLAALWRGFLADRTGTRIADTATSRIATLAAGEVRITGVVEPAEVTIVSPLQSATCVWYRAEVSPTDDSLGTWSDERGVGFRVRDASGSIRVFPGGARIDAPDRLDEKTGMFGEEPIGILVAADVELPGGRRRYREARLDPGDVVTVLGSAVPFGHLTDPAEADALSGGMVGSDDPEVVGDIAEARAAGILREPDDAWGNASIPGFGIGRPVIAPELDPAATEPTLATPAEAAEIARTWDLDADDLVLASGADGRLIVAAGGPGDVAARHQRRVVVGLLGAILAIGSALAVAWSLTMPQVP